MPQMELAELLAADSITHPPLRQVITAGEYQLVIATANRWKTSVAIAHLYKDSILQWQKPLPQHYGPRFALISTKGSVLLVDEYINVASPYALMLLSATGEAIAHYSFEDIRNTLGISAADLTRQAASGWWVADAPRLGADQTVASVGAGSQRIIIDLQTGKLTASNR